MNPSVNNFDPISFLNITTHLSDEQIATLNSQIGEYVILKLCEGLTEEQTSQINNLDGKQIYEKLKTLVPDFDKKVTEALESFEQEYQNELKKGDTNA